jgi:quinol-cytochrome oxidoreductase complex cytochrome b subunit
MNGMLLAPAVLFGFLALVPLIDRNPGRVSRGLRAVGIGLLILLIVASIYAALAPAQSHLDMVM